MLDAGERRGLRDERLEFWPTLPALPESPRKRSTAFRPTRRPACSPRPCRKAKNPCNCSPSAVNSARSTPPATPGCTTPTCWTWSTKFATRLPAAPEGVQRRDRPVRRGTGHVLFPHRPGRLDRHRRRGVCPGFLPLELGSRLPSRRHRDVLVPGGVPEPYRVGRGGNRRVLPQAHGQRPRGP